MSGEWVCLKKICRSSWPCWKDVSHRASSSPRCCVWNRNDEMERRSLPEKMKEIHFFVWPTQKDLLKIRGSAVKVHCEHNYAESILQYSTGTVVLQQASVLIGHITVLSMSENGSVWKLCGVAGRATETFHRGFVTLLCETQWWWSDDLATEKEEPFFVLTDWRTRKSVVLQ
jgi:hypothetical protein